MRVEGCVFPRTHYYLGMQRRSGLLLLIAAASISCTGSDNSPTGPDNKSASLRILVPPVSFVVGETYQLTVVDAESGSDLSTDPTVEWSSSNTSVATVAAGLITTSGEGTAQITAKSGRKSGSLTVNVTSFVRTTTQDIFSGGVLGFSSARNGGELDAYVVSPGGLARVTTSDDQEQFDGWSPDASRIAILRFPMNADLFSSHTVKADGSDDQLVSSGIVNWAPDWKHRGSVINSQVVVSNADGSDSHTVGPAGYFVQGPWWSHDGKKLAFAYSASATVPADIYVANADGTGVLDVTNTPAISEEFADWSPDGTTLALTGENPFVGTGSGIYTVSAAGSGLKQLSRQVYPRGDYEPQWSPDGKTIMFTTYFGSTYGIYIVDPAGGIPQRLSPPGLFSGFGKWSPDGRQVAFTGYNDRQSRFQDIFVMTTDRKSLFRITQNSADNLGPFWKPN